MLKLSKYMDKDTRIICALNEWVAIDENCGELTRDSNPIRLRKSRGRRKLGRPTRYYLQGTGLLNAPMIEAYTDEDAVDVVNQMFHFKTVKL